MNEGMSGWLGSLFSLAAVPAVLGAGLLQERTSAKQRTKLYAPLLCASSLGLVLLSTLKRGVSAHVVAPLLMVTITGHSDC